LVEHNLAPKSVENNNLGKAKVKSARKDTNAEIAQLVEHNLVPKVLKTTTLPRRKLNQLEKIQMRK